jgi:TrmH family RNA methyltransferase
MKTLTSARNPVLKDVRKAILRGSLTEQGYCVAEGFHLLEEALRSGCDVSAVLVSEAAQGALESRFGTLLDVSLLPENLFRDIAATETSQGVIALVKPPEHSYQQIFEGRALVPILDGIQDPGNAGAILRAAEAFGATGVVFLKGSVNPYNPKALRASAGSIFRVPLALMDDQQMLAAVDQYALELFALMPDGTLLLGDCPFDRNCAIVIGNEGRGVSESLRKRSVQLRVPSLGVESLNAAMAATVALYEARRQRT